MMNKKRLAALAMSAVMAAGTVSVPVNAADFSDGAAVQEEVAVQSVDVTEETPDAAGATVTSVVEKEWKNTDTATPTLIVTVTTDAEGETAKDYEVTTGFTKQTVNATCTQEGGYTWTVTYMGETFVSDFVKTADKADHVFEEYKKTIEEATCEKDGKLEIGLKCKNCPKTKDVTTVTIPAAHVLDGKDIIKYEAGENTVLQDGDATRVPVLANDSKDGEYDKVIYQTCKACGDEVEVSRETVSLDATQIIENSIKITDTENISTDLSAITEVSELPKDEDIVLKDCDKDGSYVISYLDENGAVVRTETHTVKAHHMYGMAEIDFVNDDDAKLCQVVKDEEKGTVTVLNRSCLKDVEYYEVYTCSVNNKHVNKVKKVAEKSTQHSANADAQKTVQEWKNDKTLVTMDEINALIEGKEEYVKFIPETVTCEADGTGSFEFYCVVCGEKAGTISGVKVAKLGHDEAVKAENVVASTCESAGSYDSVTYCKRCDKEISRKTVTTKRLAHTNELGVNTDGESTGYKDTIEGSDASIQFVGSIVFGDESVKVGAEFDGAIGNDCMDDNDSLITDGTVSAKVVTNCAVCHNNEKVLDKAAVTITVKAVKNETTNVINGNVTAPGSITLEASYTDATTEETLTKEITLPYFSKVMDTTLAYTGLHKDVDGVYRYYVDGDFAEDYSGIVDFNDNQYVVVNGVLCQDASGLNIVDNQWYFLTEGRIRTDVTQVVLYDGEWFYVTDGKLDTTVNGIISYDGAYFVFVEGRLAQEGNGLWINDKDEAYWLADGRVCMEYTGVAMYDDAFFYIVDGKLAKDFNGTVEYDGATFRVENGQLYGPIK